MSDKNERISKISEGTKKTGSSESSSKWFNVFKSNDKDKAELEAKDTKKQSWESTKSQLKDSWEKIQVDIQPRLKAARLEIDNKTNADWETNDYKDFFKSYTDAARQYKEELDTIHKAIKSVRDSDINNSISAFGHTTESYSRTMQGHINKLEGMTVLMSKSYAKSQQWMPKLHSVEESMNMYGSEFKRFIDS